MNDHLNRPQFLFCPTQYCATRAIPTVSGSEYLRTIGSKLAPNIDIMWTGECLAPEGMAEPGYDNLILN